MLFLLLNRIGANARWVLFIGSIVILFLPSSGGGIRATLPILVALVLSLTLARIDLLSLAKGWLEPRHLVELGALVGLMLPGTAVLVWLLARAFGLGGADQLNLLVYAMAAPIGSAAGMCFMLGWDAKRALEATLLATFAMPFLGPLMLGLLLPGAVEIESFALLGRLALIVGGATVLSVLIRRGLGADWIAGNPLVFDGATALVLLLFLLPVFDGVGARLVTEPMAGLRMIFFVFALNFGTSIATILGTRARLGQARAGALGIMWGNRNVGIYLAAIPAEPQLALFVALYQFPMYATPLVLSALFSRFRN